MHLLEQEEELTIYIIDKQCVSIWISNEHILYIEDAHNVLWPMTTSKLNILQYSIHYVATRHPCIN